METFGEKLRIAREQRGLSIRAVAETLRVDEQRLVALERDEFRELPDNAVMIECLEAYAECLQVEADLMIADYRRQREACLRELEDSLRPEPLPPARVPLAADRGRATAVRIAALAVVAIVAVSGLWWLLTDDVPPAPVEAGAPPSASTRPAAGAPEAAETPIPTTPTTQDEPRAVRPEPAVEPTPSSAAMSSGMSVPEHGVGTGVSGRRLVGRADRFPTGSQVWFWTNVTDGDAGDRVDHVWLHNGREMFRISLRIGGSRWRVHSAKVLSAPGAWAVEARDINGGVLARDEFHAVP